MKINKFWEYYVRSKTEDGEGGGGTGEGEGAAAGEGQPGEGEGEGKPAAAEGKPAEGEGGEGEGAGEGKGYWPEDWVTKVSKGDEKLAKRIGRYASPEAMAEALIAAQNRISSGELRTSLPENPSDEELATWRKENGIPESPDKYELKFDDGLVIGDEDKPRIDEFLKVAHEHNLTPEQAKAAIQFDFARQEAAAEERLAQDDEDAQAVSDQLNAEYGGEYRRNINMVKGVIDRFPEDVRDNLKAARLPDGRALFNDPDVIRGFVDMALEINPAGTLVPAGSGNAAQSIDSEIESIEKTMKENRTAYNKNEKMQSRYRELLAAREKLKARG